jgi:hypothetical protein
VRCRYGFGRHPPKRRGFRSALGVDAGLAGSNGHATCDARGVAERYCLDDADGIAGRNPIDRTVDRAVIRAVNGRTPAIDSKGEEALRTFTNLKVEPPRSGRDMLGGFAWLGRMTDKARAKHAGTLGDYVSLCPMDETFLRKCGVAEAEFLELIASENDDEQVAEYFERHVGPAQRAAANEWTLVEKGDHIDELDEDEGRPI